MLAALCLSAPGAGTTVAESGKFPTELFQCSAEKHVVVDFDCTSIALLEQPDLRALAQQALTSLPDKDLTNWADRAFAYDLNRDGRAELLVPLSCGATGNCSWAVITTSPSRLLAVVRGGRLYFREAGNGWSNICGYSALGAGFGVVENFVVTENRYQISWSLDVSGELNDHILSKWGQPTCNKE